MNKRNKINRTQKGGVKRAKSFSKKKSKSSSKLRRTKSQRGTPSGILTKYINSRGEKKQLPKGPPNCIENAYDKKHNCLMDPIDLACLRLSTVVQNPVNNKKCFNRDGICRWLRIKSADMNDDPESRKDFPAGWTNRNCPDEELSIVESHKIRQSEIHNQEILSRSVEIVLSILNDPGIIRYLRYHREQFDAGRTERLAPPVSVASNQLDINFAALRLIAMVAANANDESGINLERLGLSITDIDNLMFLLFLLLEWITIDENYFDLYGDAALVFLDILLRVDIDENLIFDVQEIISDINDVRRQDSLSDGYYDSQSDWEDY